MLLSLFWSFLLAMEMSSINGKGRYILWETGKLLMGDWETINVPPWTCLLYVTSANQYRCTVEASSVLFDVKGC